MTRINPFSQRVSQIADQPAGSEKQPVARSEKDFDAANFQRLTSLVGALHGDELRIKSELRKKLRQRLLSMIENSGEQACDGLPEDWKECVKQNIDIYKRAGYKQEDLDGLRWAVSNFIAEKIINEHGEGSEGEGKA